MKELILDIWIIKKENDVFVVRMKDREDINGEKMKILFAKLEELCEGKKYGVVYDGSDYEIGHLSKTAYQENLNAKLVPHRKCEAFVFNSLPIRMVINFYHKMFKPPYPSAAFKSVEEAIKWMKTI